MAVALGVGTIGALITSITSARAAHHVAELAAARAMALATAANQTAPVVTDATKPGKSKHGLAAPKMSPAMLLANRVKQAQATDYLRHARPPSTRYLAATQQAQARNYWCGPATVSEMLAQVGVVLNQNAAARQLGTNASGTDWSNNHGYPVAKVMNANQSRTKYVAVGLPWSPTNAQVTRYEKDLLTDLNRGNGVPLAGNAYEVPGGPHLVGHPAGQQIMHWFDIRGYAQSGAVTAYEDSVHGAASIAWGSSVPAYSTLPSTTIVYILGARGYVW
ncbi:MAG TPA: C39 family peptidase [Streptosporangiaceae bacterium]|nr:C39 family peptidase [Streptosporangiaceae bacterium]